jgi:histone H3/H4
MAENASETVHVAVQKAQEALKRIDPAPFSDAAFTELTASVSRYVVELAEESVKLSKHHADGVSTGDVQRAAANLFNSRKAGLARHAGMVAGIFLGLSLSQAATMLTVGPLTSGGFVATLVAGIIGGFAWAVDVKWSNAA